MDILDNYVSILQVLLIIFSATTSGLLFVKTISRRDLSILGAAISTLIFTVVYILFKYTTYRSIFILDFSLLLMFVATASMYTISFTSRKYKVFLENKRLEKTLEDLMYKYKVTIDSSPIGFYIYNKSLTLEYVNDRACELLGYTRPEVIGTPITNYIAAGDLNLALQKADDRFSGKVKNDKYELTMKKKSGELIKVIIISSKTENGHSTVTGSILTDEQCSKGE